MPNDDESLFCNTLFECLITMIRYGLMDNPGLVCWLYVKVQLTSKIAFAFGGGTHSIYYFLVSNPIMVHWLLVECFIRISLSIHGELLNETSSINVGYSWVIKVLLL